MLMCAGKVYYIAIWLPQKKQKVLILSSIALALRMGEAVLR
jgi:hypothetical protein